MTTLAIIFAKEPVPGQVKTRLTPPLPPEEACRLYGCFLEDTLAETARVPGIEVALAYAPARSGEAFRHLLPAEVRLLPQEGVDLGQRMTRAFAWGFAAGFEIVLLRGSDTPDLPGRVLTEAREQLTSGQAELVLGPSADGGYYLVALKAPHPRLFEGISWSSTTVLADTLSRARGLGLKVHLLRTWADIDNYADLENFLARPHLPPQPGWRSDRTARELLSAQGKVIRANDIC